jgi:hypothetical protein
MMGRDAVIKFLKPELSHHEEMVRRFFNEARAAASIEDPGIVNVFDVGKLDDGRAFIVMERLRGESLAERLRKRRLGVEEAALLLRLLARSLGAAHALGIVHRDLKPDNIFLVPDRDVPGGERTKILDFGIAKLAGGATMLATRAGSIFGTPAYMAPEQCSDAAAVDHRADLYALGCIAYEMLAGTPPFGLGGLEVLASHMRDEPPPLSSKVSGVPRGFEAVIHTLLAKDPNRRYPSCVELVAAIDALRIPAPGVLSSATVAAPTPVHGRAPTPAPVSAPTPYPVVTPTPYLPPSSPPSAHPPLTTHSAASGMVVPQTAPPPAPRGKGLVIAIVAGVALAAAAAVALVVMKGGDGGAAAKRPPTASEQLEIAEAAFREERWDDAMLAAMKVLAIDEHHARAAELAEQARVEGEHGAAWKRMQKHAGVDDFPALMAAYNEIGDDSAYHDRADELRVAEQDAWLDVQLPALAALAEKGECGEHGRLLASVEHWVAPGEPRLVEARACNPAKVAAVTPDAAVVEVPVPPKDKAKDPRKDKAKAKDGKTAEVKKDPPPPPKDKDDDEPAANDPEATLAEARSALKQKNYRAALKGAEQVLAARSDGEAQMIATVAACGLGNETKAKKHLPKGRSSYREISIHRCGVLGIDLE